MIKFGRSSHIASNWHIPCGRQGGKRWRNMQKNIKVVWLDQIYFWLLILSPVCHFRFDIFIINLN